jgi:hypothetical protein
MNRSKALARRVQEVLLDGKWVANTNFKEQLLSVSWEQATQQVGDLNTIALLTFHINYYLGGLLTVFDGGTLDIRDQYSFDLEPITSEEAWNALVTQFLTNAERFVRCVEALPERTLDEVFVDAKYGDYARNIEGVIEHGYYHLGQVVLVRKMIDVYLPAGRQG